MFVRRASGKITIRYPELIPAIGWLWPILLACVALAVILGVAGFHGVLLTGGGFAYALDDAYIHMALARNLSEYGLLGATPFEFTSASSSPLWTALLAASFILTGVNVYAPLALAAFSMFASIILIDRILLRNLKTPWRAIILLAVILVTPAVALVLSGMEHALQIALNIVLVGAALKYSATDNLKSEWRHALLIGLLIVAAVMTRYETLALVVAICIMLLIRKRAKMAAVAFGAAAMAVAGFGAWAMAQGGPFLPNPILMKGVNSLAASMAGADNPINGLIGRLHWNLSENAYPLNLLIATSAILLAHDVIVQRRAAFLSTPGALSLVMLITAIGHMAMGAMGDLGWWLFRYEAYLYALALPTVAVQLSALWDTCVTFRSTLPTVICFLSIAVLVCSMPGMLKRAHESIEVVPLAMKNIYEQPLQVASLLKNNVGHAHIALNDLGAIAFFNDQLKVFDFAGLGVRDPSLQMSVARGEREEAALWNAAAEAGVEFAVVSADWFRNWPGSWQPVATWQISDSVDVVHDTVTFVAAPNANAKTLRAMIREYSKESLPHTVKVEILN